MRSIGLLFLCVLSFTQSFCNDYGPKAASDHTSANISYQLFSTYSLQGELPRTFAATTSVCGPGNGNYLASSFTETHSPVSAFANGLARYSGFVVSAGLITYGAVAQCNPWLKKVNADADTYARHLFPGRMHVDDYIQYVPIAAYLALDFTRVKAKHNFLERTVVAAASYLFMAAIVNGMKLTIPVLRPDGSAWNSFPSGHTATAFTGAHLLFREYKETSPWIGIAGYAAATATGIMRMLNKRHWLSDVAAGAGIGILSVELSYLLLPLFEKAVYGANKKRGNVGMTLMPALGGGYYGASFACVF